MLPEHEDGPARWNKAEGERINGTAGKRIKRKNGAPVRARRGEKARDAARQAASLAKRCLGCLPLRPKLQDKQTSLPDAGLGAQRLLRPGPWSSVTPVAVWSLDWRGPLWKSGHKQAETAEFGRERLLREEAPAWKRGDRLVANPSRRLARGTSTRCTLHGLSHVFT
ncbi:uncharacterized protein AAG666_001721 isoform 2-T6 [Megaptera novaeangliae]